LVADILLPKDRSSDQIVQGGLAIGWLVALAVQLYVADTAIHASMVGAYIPPTLLGAARIPSWAFLIPAAIDGAAAWAAGSLPVYFSRTIAALSFALLLAYAFTAVGSLFYVAFSYGT
jgi:hypothetical protein